MKTIVVCPEIIGYHNSAFREPRKPLNKPLVACTVLLPLVALAGWFAGRSTSAPRTEMPAPAARVAPATIPTVRPLVPLADGAVELQTALENGQVKGDFSGNGRDRLTAELSNHGRQPVTVQVSFGQLFECGRNTVATARTVKAEVPAGKSLSLVVPTVATRSINRVAPATYRLSTKTAPKIDLLLTYAQDHPELSLSALQTAVLALTENLPLSAVCKFSASGSDLPSRFDTAAFRVETFEIVAALSALREIGVRDRDLAMTVDPQLKIEGMIDPACRTAAMRYYGITAEKEWDYWKKELLEGDPSTRHYALYGIARFYPAVAVEMLPKWAREKRTTQLFRLTALQALGETQRPEALPLLSDLVNELGRNTELGRAALQAAQLLDTSLRKVTDKTPTVAFRSSVGAAPF